MVTPSNETGGLFHPWAVYSTAEVETILKGRCSLETFRRVLRLAPAAHGFWLGSQIIRALEQAAVADPVPPRPAKVADLHRRGNRNGRPGGLEPIRMEELDPRGVDK